MLIKRNREAHAFVRSGIDSEISGNIRSLAPILKKANNMMVRLYTILIMDAAAIVPVQLSKPRIKNFFMLRVILIQKQHPGSRSAVFTFLTLNSADVEVLKYNNELETIAKLVEAKAKTPEEAAELIRGCKLKT